MSGQDPTYYHTPGKPSRQPSQHGNRLRDQQQQSPQRNAAPPSGYTPSPRRPTFQDATYPQEQSPYNRPPPQHLYSQPFEANDSQSTFQNPYDATTPGYNHNDGSQQQQAASSYGGHYRGPSETGLRQRGGDSISHSQHPQQYGTAIGDLGYPPTLAVSPLDTRSAASSPSLYPAEESKDYWQQHQPSHLQNSVHGNDMSYYNNGYPQGNDPYHSAPHLPYGDSQVHLTQSEEGGYESVNMNNAAPPGSRSQLGYPPFPGPHDPYNQNNQSYAGSDSYMKHEQGNNGFPGGFIGLAAPGTMLLQPNQFNAGYTAVNDPRAYDETRERLLRRRTVKKIALTNGNLVLDIPVPGSICKSGQSEEFRTSRYSAATCDPDNWNSGRFTLRPYLAKRETELAICMTCYNEDEQLLFRTLGSVIRNIGYLNSRSRSKTWGNNGWTKIVVFIIGDGRKKANERMLKMLACYGLFSEGAMKDHVLEKEVTAHVFELTTQVIVDPNGGIEVAKCPVQLVFCLKEKNQKKINSHRWFFNAFCQQLNPNVTILLDVGTMPTDHSLYYLWKTFDKHKKVGGACGEIAVDVGTFGWRLYNPLVASQNFEYKMSNILDKPLESVMGFIGVLPGAFSAYRWKALKGRPLEAYFKGEALHNGTMTGGSFVNNLYLAEDRILCFELVVKSNEAWILKYVKAAKATTDVPDGVAELIAQRRRWLNGSLFASMFAVIHFWRIWTSGQSFLRKIVLQLQMIYNLIQIIFTWTSLANFFLAMYFLMKSATSNPNKDPFAGQGQAVFEVCQNLYIALVVVVVVTSLGSRPQGFNAMYLSVIILFGSLFVLLLYCTGWTIYLQLEAADLLTAGGWTGSNIVHTILNSSNIRSIVISILATFVLYLVSSLWMLDPWHMVTSFLQYLFLTPTYVTILSIYSLANLHDVSWGTKGSDAASTDLGGASLKKSKEGDTIVEVKVPTSAQDAQELWQHAQADLARKHVETKQKRSAALKQTDHQQNFRTKFLLFWLGTNAALIIIFTSSWWNNYTKKDLGLSTNPYLSFLFFSTAGLSACRALGSLTYVIFRLFGQ